MSEPIATGLLSACGYALLAVITARFEDSSPITFEELYFSVPAAVGQNREIGDWIRSWPSNASEWTEELIALKRRGLVLDKKHAGELYFFPTNDGFSMLRAFLDPRRGMERIAS